MKQYKLAAREQRKILIYLIFCITQVLLISCSNYAPEEEIYPTEIYYDLTAFFGKGYEQYLHQGISSDETLIGTLEILPESFNQNPETPYLFQIDLKLTIENNADHKLIVKKPCTTSHLQYFLDDDMVKPRGNAYDIYLYLEPVNGDLRQVWIGPSTPRTFPCFTKEDFIELAPDEDLEFLMHDYEFGHFDGLPPGEYKITVIYSNFIVGYSENIRDSETRYVDVGAWIGLLKSNPIYVVIPE